MSRPKHHIIAALVLALGGLVLAVARLAPALQNDCSLLFCPQQDSSNSRHLILLELEYFLDQKIQADQLAPPPPANNLSAGELVSLKRHMSKRLGRYQGLFKQVASEHRMDWKLVAAISYQESHWHPRAKSPTGVRGMMMLTLPTAREMGVRNRLDAEQSVRGGVAYLKRLKARLPETIQEPDRTWIALAAYNIGMGHLYDARRLTREHGDNPDSWHNLRRYLPRLEDPHWHSQVRYGYARGSEPVHYVDNIQRYYRHIANSRSGEVPAIARTESSGATTLL